MSKTIEEILAPKPQARPRIYAYSIADPAHAGLLKVGQPTSKLKNMKNTKCEVRFFGFYSLMLAGILFSGCAPTSRTSKYMAESSGAPASPPAGKTLVCVHRPKATMEYKLYAGIWDGTKFIADLGNGHSVAYVCEPGQHYFLELSPDSPACVEAQLLPDKTYDLWIDNFPIKLKPIHQGDKNQQQVAVWSSETHWVTPAASATDYEQRKQAIIQQVLGEFISGKRHDALQQLAAEDHR